MASVLTRLSVSNDTGTPASPNGDGTLINAALLTLLQDNIDALLTVGGSGSPGVLTIGADLAVEGFGTHTFSAGGTGGNELRVRNTTAGTGNFASLTIGNDDSATAAYIYQTSTTYTPSGRVVADGLHIETGRAGGITIAANNASGEIRFHSAAATSDALRLNTSGKLLLRHGGASHDGNYGPLSITGPGTNFGQQLSLIRSGAAIWSLGYAYNSSTFAIGAGQSTDSNFTAAAAALTISTAGETNLPLQPSVTAYNSAADTGLTTQATVDFDTELHDANADFASDTFTAPVAGKYLLVASIGIRNDSGSAKYFEAFFWDGTNGYTFGREWLLADTYETVMSGSIILSLAASATITVKVDCGVGATFRVLAASTYRQTYFSGHLLA